MTRRLIDGAHPTLRDIDRFWSKVDRSDDAGCHLWNGPVNSQGYGRFELWLDGQRHRVLAHRFAFILAGGDPATPVVRHSCDTPPCVRRGHLLAGTQTDNMRDARARGRLDLVGLQLGALTNRKHYLCTVAGCRRPHHAQGLCSSHYMKRWRAAS